MCLQLHRPAEPDFSTIAFSSVCNAGRSLVEKESQGPRAPRRSPSPTPQTRDQDVWGDHASISNSQPDEIDGGSGLSGDENPSPETPQEGKGRGEIRTRPQLQPSPPPKRWQGQGKGQRGKRQRGWQRGKGQGKGENQICWRLLLTAFIFRTFIRTVKACYYCDWIQDFTSYDVRREKVHCGISFLSATSAVNATMPTGTNALPATPRETLAWSQLSTTPNCTRHALHRNLQHKQPQHPNPHTLHQSRRHPNQMPLQNPSSQTIGTRGTLYQRRS